MKFLPALCVCVFTFTFFALLNLLPQGFVPIFLLFSQPLARLKDQFSIFIRRLWQHLEWQFFLTRLFGYYTLLLFLLHQWNLFFHILSASFLIFFLVSKYFFAPGLSSGPLLFSVYTTWHFLSEIIALHVIYMLMTHEFLSSDPISPLNSRLVYPTAYQTSPP